MGSTPISSQSALHMPGSSFEMLAVLPAVPYQRIGEDTLPSKRISKLQDLMLKGIVCQAYETV